MATKKAEINYRALTAELDGLIERLQEGDLSIDEAMKCYERGSDLIKELQAYLKTAENKVSKLKVDVQANDSSA